MNRNICIMPVNFQTSIDVARRNPQSYKILRNKGGRIDILRKTPEHTRVQSFDRNRNLVNVLHKYESGLVVQHHYANTKYLGTWFYNFSGIMKKFVSKTEYKNYLRVNYLG